jgi:hypothetical protein
MPLARETTEVFERNLFFAYPYSMYALPTDVLETLSVNEVDPILRTFVETAVAPKALFIAG